MKGFAESQSVGEAALGILLGKVERRPHEGEGRGGRGHTGIPHEGGSKGNPGKGVESGKGIIGMPTNREGGEETPGRGWEGAGVSQGPPTLGGGRRDPTRGRTQGRVINTDPHREEGRRDPM